MALIEAFEFSFQCQRGSHQISARKDVLEIVDVQPIKDGKAKKDAQVQDFLKLIADNRLSLDEGEV